MVGGGGGGRELLQNGKLFLKKWIYHTNWIVGFFLKWILFYKMGVFFVTKWVLLTKWVGSSKMGPKGVAINPGPRFSMCNVII